MIVKSPANINGIILIPTRNEVAYFDMDYLDMTELRSFFFADPATLRPIGHDEDAPHVLAAYVESIRAGMSSHKAARRVILDGAECDIAPPEEVVLAVATEIKAERVAWEANLAFHAALHAKRMKNRDLLDSMMAEDTIRIKGIAEAAASWVNDNTPIHDQWQGDVPEPITLKTIISGIVLRVVCVPYGDDNTEWVSAPSRFGGGYVAGGVIGRWKLTADLEIEGRPSTIAIGFCRRVSHVRTIVAEMEINGAAFESHDDFLDAIHSQNKSPAD